jgi:hypothetical protein
MAPTTLSFPALSNDELATVVPRLAASERHAIAALVAALAEMDARNLHAREGYSSLFAYCTGRLRLSEPAACRRIEAARAGRRFPVVLTRLAEGTLTLAAIGMLARHLTPANQAAVLDAARHRSKRDIEELVARIAPQPDIASSIRKLPVRRRARADAAVQREPDAVAAAAGHAIATGHGAACEALAPGHRATGVAHDVTPPTAARPLLEAAVAPLARPDCASGADTQRGVPPDAPLTRDSPGLSPAPLAAARSAEQRSEERCVATAASSVDTVAAALPASRPAVIRPLAPARYQVQVTVSAETHAKLLRARDLLRHAIPSGDPALVIDRALTVLLERLEKAKFAALTSRDMDDGASTPPRARRSKRNAMQPARAKRAAAPDAASTGLPNGSPARPRDDGGRHSGKRTAAPAKTAAPPSRYVPAAVRREVWTRSRGQCEFVADDGHRCEQRGFLELHHRVPFASGGVSTATNLRLYCKGHNQREAELFFGTEFTHQRGHPGSGVDSREAAQGTGADTPTGMVGSPSLATADPWLPAMGRT